MHVTQCKAFTQSTPLIQHIALISLPRYHSFMRFHFRSITKISMKHTQQAVVATVTAVSPVHYIQCTQLKTLGPGCVDNHLCVRITTHHRVSAWPDQLTVSRVVLYRIRYLSLPVSQVTAVATLLVPPVTGLSLRQSRDVAFSGKTRGRFAMTVTVLLIIYYTVIVTLSMSHMVPPNNLTCGLEQQWLRLFTAKDQNAIKRIQDSHQCCGLHSAKDKAWPFPDGNHGSDACLNAFGRKKPCFGDWRRDEQIVGGLMILVAVITALIKV